LRSTPACSATLRSPEPDSQARSTSRVSVTATSRNAISRTPKSIDLKAPDTGSDQDPRHDTPGGPITGNQVVPCSWQKTPHGGPMTVAGDSRSRSCGSEGADRAPRVPEEVVGRGLSRSLLDNTAAIATWLDAREPSSQLAFDQPGSLSRQPCAARAVILAPDCPVRRHRVKGGLTGRRMRSAAPTLTRWPLTRRFGACEDDETNAWRRGAGKGHAIAAPPCSRPS
jgi:hypothetical protein